MPGAVRTLMDIASRASRHAQPGLAIVLNLSALTPPAPKPHHRRVARALLLATAEQHDGEVVRLDGDDLALVCRQKADGEPVNTTAPLAASPEAVPALLHRLLQAEAGDREMLVRTWHLPAEAAELEAYLQGRDAVPPRPVPSAAKVSHLLQEQTAVALLPGEGRPLLQPLFHEVSISLGRLAGLDTDWHEAEADPFIARALMPSVDARLLVLLERAHGSLGPLDTSVPGLPALHVNLTPQAIVSPAFARFAQACGPPGQRRKVGIEMSLVEALGDPALFAEAGARVAAERFECVLDEVPVEALRLADLSALAPARIKLLWTAREADPADRAPAALDAALRRIGRSRIVLGQADSDAAIRWGLDRRIRRFQGHSVDLMLAHGRFDLCQPAA